MLCQLESGHARCHGFESHLVVTNILAHVLFDEGQQEHEHGRRVGDDKVEEVPERQPTAALLAKLLDRASHSVPVHRQVLLETDQQDLQTWRWKVVETFNS